MPVADKADEPSKERLVVVSNRLPVMIRKGESGEWGIEPGTGGLVTAVAPILRNRGGLWLGWPGKARIEKSRLDLLLAQGGEAAGYKLKPVLLTKEEEENYYRGFSNEILWPLFHDLQTRCNMDSDFWSAYQWVNRKFAKVIVEDTAHADFVWIHDYHLMLVAKILRSMGIDRRISFFLHIPFPSPDIFLKLPWREKILRALLDYDLIGFQSQRDRQNFIRCIHTLMKDVAIRGKGRVLTVPWPGRGGKVGVFPVGIDYNLFCSQATTDEVSRRAELLREDLPGRQIILGVDRLDYTKGIPSRLEAFRSALRHYPDMRERVTLVQVVVPSRRNIPEYEDLKTEIERLVGEINGEFTRSGWVPIHYLFRSLPFDELLAYYRASEIALVTPLKDGMNLVAKEFCAASIDERGVLVLSEFAGTAAQLKRGALLVNPYDIDGVAKTIYRAFSMSSEERRSRMRKMRKSIRQHNVFWWVDSFLKAAVEKDLHAYPPRDDLAVHTPDIPE